MAQFTKLCVCVAVFFFAHTAIPSHGQEIYVRERIPPVLTFDHVEDFYNGRAVVAQIIDNTWQFAVIDSDGNFVIPFFPHNTRPHQIHFSEGLVPIPNEGLFGFYDLDGEQVIDYLFLDAQPFSEGLAPVRFAGWNQDQWGFINTAGEVVIPPAFDMTLGFSEGLAPVKQGQWQSGWGFVDTSGNMAIYPSFFQAFGFTDGFAIVSHVNDPLVEPPQIGIINRYGHVVAWFDFPFMIQEHIPPRISEGLVSAGVALDDGLILFGFMDTTGNMAIPPIFERAHDFSQGRAAVGAIMDGEPHMGNELLGLIDRYGHVVVPHMYHSIGAFSQERAPVLVRTTSNQLLWGFIDPYGNEVIAPAYASVLPFSEGLAAVMIGGQEGTRAGFIDRYDYPVVPFRFDYVRNFSHGFAWVNLDGRWGILEIYTPSNRWRIAVGLVVATISLAAFVGICIKRKKMSQKV